MKVATCKQLKGACEEKMYGETPDEMAENSKKHAMEMAAQNDAAHLAAMKEMMEMSPEEQKKWYDEEFVATFDDLLDA